MNKYLLTILLPLLCNHLYAQTYQYVPIPTNNAVWKISEYKIVGPGYGNCNKYLYELDGSDTLVGSDTFHRVKILGSNRSSSQDQSCHDGTAFNTPFTSTGQAGYAWVIEKDKKIYALLSLPLDTAVTKPYLNFNLSQVGERASGPRIGDTVVQIDTVNINGSLRKRIIARFNNDYTDGGVLDTMIEGIGSIRFGLGFKHVMEEGYDMRFRARVICLSVNTQQEYVYGNSACADIWPLTISGDIKASKDIVITPNPFNNQVRLQGGKDGVLNVYDVLGRRVYSHIYSDNNEVSIPTSDWPAGMYMFITEQNGVRNIEKLVKY